MRVFFVLCALLAITVTSLAHPKDVGDTNGSTTTAIPVVTKTKNDSLNITPASVEKSTEKVTNAASYITPSVPTVDKPKDQAKPNIVPVQTSEAATQNSKNDLTTAIAPTEKIATTPKPVKITDATPTVAISTNAVPNVTTAVPATTMCPPSQERHFDGLSFLGGITLTVCLIGVGVFLCKYCQNIHEDKYRTL